MSLYTKIRIPEKIRDYTISRFSMSVRLRNVLTRGGYERIGELDGVLYAQIKQIPNCGTKTIEELRQIESSLKTDISEASSAKNDEQITINKLYVPECARGWPLTLLPLSERLSNALMKANYQRLGDIHNRAINEITDIVGVGDRSIHEIEEFVRDVQQGKFDTHELTCEDGINHFINFLTELVNGLHQNERTVITNRLSNGFSLERVGTILNISRERVRQIERVALRKIEKEGSIKLFRILDDFNETLNERVCPLTASLLASWLVWRESELPYSLDFYIELIGKLNTKIPVWTKRDKYKQITDTQQKKLVNELAKILCKDYKPLPLRNAFTLLKENTKFDKLTSFDFMNRLKSQKKMKVSFESAGRPLIHPPKLSTKQIAHFILKRSKTPLTPEQIVIRSKLISMVDTPKATPRTLENMLSHDDSVFYRLKPRSFGLIKHFHLQKSVWKKIADDIHTFLLVKNRPVSTLEIINEDILNLVSSTNKYELAEILCRDDRFIDLGRLHFSLQAWGIQERVYIKDLIPKILEKHQRPLTTAEIFKSLKEIRSVSPTSLPIILKNIESIRYDGFGYYSLITLQKPRVKFFITKSQLVSRLIAKMDPPLSFNDLCVSFGFESGHEEAKILWKTLLALRRVTISTTSMDPNAEIIHERWRIDQLVYSILKEERKAMPIYEIQWELRDRFGQMFDRKPLQEIKKRLGCSSAFVIDPQGNYMLAESVSEDAVMSKTIIRECKKILESNREIMSSLVLMDRIEANGLSVRDLTPSILSTILRGDNSIEEISKDLFKV